MYYIRVVCSTPRDSYPNTCIPLPVRPSTTLRDRLLETFLRGEKNKNRRDEKPLRRMLYARVLYSARIAVQQSLFAARRIDFSRYTDVGGGLYIIIIIIILKGHGNNKNRFSSAMGIPHTQHNTSKTTRYIILSSCVMRHISVFDTINAILYYIITIIVIMFQYKYCDIISIKKYIYTRIIRIIVRYQSILITYRAYFKGQFDLT